MLWPCCFDDRARMFVWLYVCIHGTFCVYFSKWVHAWSCLFLGITRHTGWLKGPNDHKWLTVVMHMHMQGTWNMAQDTSSLSMLIWTGVCIVHATWTFIGGYTVQPNVLCAACKRNQTQISAVKVCHVCECMHAYEKEVTSHDRKVVSFKRNGANITTITQFSMEPGSGMHVPLHIAACLFKAGDSVEVSLPSGFFNVMIVAL